MITARSSTLLGSALALAIGVAPLTASAAGTPDQACRAAKLKASGKYAAALASCHAKAIAKDAMVDGECLTKAAGKMTGAFTKADTKGDSTCSGLEPSSSEDVQALVAAILAAAPAAPGGGKCPSSIYKAAGKLASAELSAWSKFVTGGDSAKRDGAITKALGKLSSAVTKAEANEGCAGTGQEAAVVAAVNDGIAPLLACLAGTGTCAEEVVDAGETVTTDPEGNGPDAETPIVASIETPVAGTVTLHVVDAGAPPSGYEILGQEVEITAPVASAASPLVLTFVIDASLLPMDPMSVSVARNGVVVADCTGTPGTADPDPCIQSRTIIAGGDLEIVALTSQASLWSMVAPSGPTTTVTTTTLPEGDYWMRWEVRADTTGNDVATEIDFGWTGITHNIDPSNGSAIRFGLDCPSASLPGSYGECTVTGFDPAEGNCRCSNDTATVCDEPSAADSDDCGGSTCECYTRPPLAAVTGGTPICLVGRASSDASGTWNPDTGSGDVTLNELMRLHLGIQVEKPCPVCVGDVTANDGVRNGTCSGGQTNGAACDAQATDPTYPAPGGGATSLDCMPSNASNISGLGMRFPHVETTSAVSLPSSMPCVDNPSENCPCASCSSDTSYGCASNADCVAALGYGCNLDPFESCDTNADCLNVDEGTCNQFFHACQGALSVPCTTNADCSSVNVGPCVAPTCSERGQGQPPQPNACFTTCTEGTGGESTCDNSDKFCDGLLEEDGKGIVACFDDTDCSFFSAGACTIEQARPCFQPTIAATGASDSDSPRTVATLCLAATSNPSVNAASGLPGPARLRTDWTVTYGQ